MRTVRIEKIVAAVILLGGIALRLAQYLGNRSLWGDEVAVAVNLRTRGFAGLLHPLGYDQTMPFGLLFVLKSTVSLLGFSELALRLPLLLAGCGLLILTWICFSKVFERRVVLLTLALMAVSQPLIYYSAELKQYGVDVLITVLMVWLGVTLLKNTSDEGWPRLILGGAVALLFSQPTVFILASMGIATVVDRRFRTSSRWRVYAFVAAVVWFLIFGLLYWFSYRATSHSEFMRAFWSRHFIGLHSSDFRGSLSLALITLLGMARLARVRTLILSCLFLAGVYAIWRKHGTSIATVTAGPFALLLLAAALGQYPVAARLVLFSAPILLLIYSSAISLIVDLLPEKYSNLAFGVLSCLFIVPTLHQTVTSAYHFRQREATRDLSRKIEAAHDRAPVYLVFGHYTQWGYYGGDWNHPEVWKPRIDAAYTCQVSAELGYVAANRDLAPNCVNLTYPATTDRPEEIVGNPPPSPKEGPQADDRWAAAEALRIASTPSQSVWLFLPVYSENFITGAPKQRGLLEKLESQLGYDQCRLVEADAQGDSLAHRYECDDHNLGLAPH